MLTDEMKAECNIPNCRNRAPASEAFCSKHRGRKRVPFAYCCAEAGGDITICDCVNPSHGTAIIAYRLENHNG